MSDVGEEVVAMNRDRDNDDDNWLLSSRRLLRSTMAAIEASPCEGNDKNVDICFRMRMNGDGERTYWIVITIPGKTTTLRRLSRVGSSNYYNHEHDIDVAAPALSNNYDILQNRFRLVSACDQLKGPFPPHFPYFTPAVSWAVLDSIVYCLGGDPNDIPDYCEEIFAIRGSRPPDHHRPTTQYDLTQSYANIVEKILSCNLKPPPEPGDGICHNIYTLNMLEPFSGWTKCNGKPLISPRLTPLFVSYQGKLYAFNGNISSVCFAEVYDLVSHAWTQLPSPPFGWLPDTQFIVRKNERFNF